MTDNYWELSQNDPCSEFVVYTHRELIASHTLNLHCRLSSDTRGVAWSVEGVVTGSVSDDFRLLLPPAHSERDST